ncbi:MAG: hypothetical protein KKE79_00980 [Actinobacteria bacterium]|nr:hypothetical protein [Actinomycetota bacterium]MBU4489192.1 hypothetical protein [Actinomycetota bacterium]
MMSRSRPGPRTVILITVSLLALLLVAGVTAFFWHRSRSNARRAEEYQQAVAGDWDKLARQSESVDAALTRVDSPDDLGNVAVAAGAMREELQRVIAAREKNPPPSGERDLERAETECLTSLDSFLEMVEELAGSGNEQDIVGGRALLESRAAQALSNVNDFIFKAKFIIAGISGTFFQAGLLENAYRPPEWQSGNEELVYQIVSTFMDADIKQFNPDVLWSLASSKRIVGLGLMGVTRENFAGGWRKAWGEKHPVDFYVSRRDITFTDPNTVEVKVIVYLERGAPWIDTVRLVKEADGWKVEGYTFVGWG